MTESEHKIDIIKPVPLPLTSEVNDTKLAE